MVTTQQNYLIKENKRKVKEKKGKLKEKEKKEK